MSSGENRAMASGVIILLMVGAALVVLVGLSFTMGGFGMMGGAMGLGMLMFALPLLLVILLVAVLVDRPEGRTSGPPPRPGFYGEHPLQILDRKYANGEMNYQEYVTLRDEIVRRQGGPGEGR